MNKQSEYVQMPRWLVELMFKMLNEEKWPTTDTRWQTVELATKEALKQ